MSGIRNPRLVVVTGAGSGIGRATAQAFAWRGALVICVDIDEAAAKNTAQSCGNGAIAYLCDVRAAEDVIELAATVEREHGAVDVLVNNAGVGVGGDFLDCSLEDWHWIRSVNLDGVVYGCHAFGSYMRERQRGHVVNVSSGLGFYPNRRTTNYCTTKAGVLMLSEALRADWTRHGVGVSAICPGFINTPILEASRLRGVDDTEQGRFAWALRHGHSPHRVAEAIVKASAKNQAVVPVGIEATAGYLFLRFLPAPLRNLMGRL